MSIQLKLRRGTTAQHSTFTGAEGEVTVDTTKDTLVVHDGATPGGKPMMPEAGTSSTGVFSLGGSQFYKDTSGNVGIGTSSPSYKLDVSHSSFDVSRFVTTSENTDARVNIEGLGTGLGALNSVRNGLVFQVAGTERARIDSSGNVGIGTATPASYGKLAVNSADNSQAFVAYSTSGAVRIIPWVTGSSAAHLEGVNAAQSAYVPLFINGYSLSLGTGGTERARIDVPGNFYFDSGYGSVAVAYGCRAWVYFNGTGSNGANQTISASGNVSSVYKNASGDYTINFATALPDSNYSLVGNYKDTSTSKDRFVSSNSGSARSTTQAGINTTSSGNTAVNGLVSVAVFR